jgi:hypothetical protein
MVVESTGFLRPYATIFPESRVSSGPTVGPVDEPGLRADGVTGVGEYGHHADNLLYKRKKALVPLNEQAYFLLPIGPRLTGGLAEDKANFA